MCQFSLVVGLSLYVICIFIRITFAAYDNSVPSSTPIQDTRFHIIRRALSWTGGLRECHNKGWKLAVFNSKEEAMKTILQLKLMSDKSPESEFSLDRRYWIGLFDFVIEGEWTWLDGGDWKNFGHYFWAPGQPDHYQKGITTHCISLWNVNIDNDDYHHFDDDDCTHKYYPICGEPPGARPAPSLQSSLTPPSPPASNLSTPYPIPYATTTPRTPEGNKTKDKEVVVKVYLNFPAMPNTTTTPKPAPSPVFQPPAPPANVVQPPAPPANVVQPPVPPATVVQPPVPPATVVQPPVPPSTNTNLSFPPPTPPTVIIIRQPSVPPNPPPPPAPPSFIVIQPRENKSRPPPQPNPDQSVLLHPPPFPPPPQPNQPGILLVRPPPPPPVGSSGWMVQPPGGSGGMPNPGYPGGSLVMLPGSPPPPPPFGQQGEHTIIKNRKRRKKYKQKQIPAPIPPPFFQPGGSGYPQPASKVFYYNPPPYGNNAPVGMPTGNNQGSIVQPYNPSPVMVIPAGNPQPPYNPSSGGKLIYVQQPGTYPQPPYSPTGNLIIAHPPSNNAPPRPYPGGPIFLQPSSVGNIPQQNRYPSPGGAVMVQPQHQYVNMGSTGGGGMVVLNGGGNMSPPPQPPYVVGYPAQQPVEDSGSWEYYDEHIILDPNGVAIHKSHHPVGR